MKYLSILSLALCLCISINMNGQKGAAPDCDIPLMIYIPYQSEPLPDGAESFLENKLSQIAVKNGMSAGPDFAQFVIAPKITIVTKDVLPGPPTQFALNMDMTLYIGDRYGDKSFATTTVSIKGVGTNETKAYLDGIKKINVNNPAYQKFLSDGKDKIVAYYNANYQSIIKKAQSQAGMKNFEEALYNLMSIPNCCTGYDLALKEASRVYQLYIDDLCNQNLSSAKMAWAQEQNSNGAEAAGEYLQYIYPDAKCYKEAMALHKEIKSKVLADWKFAMKIYNDAVSLEKQRISAWRDVGVAYGKGQKATQVNLIWVR